MSSRRPLNVRKDGILNENNPNNGDVYYAPPDQSQVVDQQAVQSQQAYQGPDAYCASQVQQQYVAEPAPASYGAPTYASAYASPIQPAKKRNTGLIIGIVAIVAVCAVIIASIASCSSMMTGVYSSLGLSGDSEPAALSDEPKVAVISLGGTIQYDGTECSPEGLRTLLKEAQKRDDVKAVVLHVDSGGGVATAGEEMAKYVKDFSKPVVVSSAATNASAAYEISSQADYIFTAKTTAIGSIGVALQVTDLSGLYEKLGINIDNITSAESKDSSYGNRPLTEEERAWYQNMVDRIDSDFVQTVADGRGLAVAEVEKLANGLTYVGMEAVDNGLADEIGYYEDAVKHASELAGYDYSLKTTNLTLSSESSLATLIDLLGQSKSSDEEALATLIHKYGDGWIG